MTARHATLAAGLCWLAIIVICAGVALIALNPKHGWIGVTVIFGALIGALCAGAWLRRGQRDDDPGGGEP